MDAILKLPVGIDRTAVVGPAERNLKALREALDLKVAARGGSVHLNGSARSVATAKEAIRRLIEAAELGQPMNRQQLSEAIAQASAVRERVRSGWETQPDEPGEQAAFDAREEDWGTFLNVYVAGRPVRARGANQVEYLRLIQRHDVVFGLGPAGTGKTYLAVAAAVHMLRASLVRKVVLTRPAVEAGEKLGFLPGDVREKVHPYLRPLFDALHDMMDFATVRRFMETDVVEVCPLAFMRGRTLNHAAIILDEAQNCTLGQIKMFLTRMGQGSKVIVTGDPSQTDLPEGSPSGLTRAAALLARTPGVGFVGFDKADVVRHELVRRIIEAFDKGESNQRSRTIGRRAKKNHGWAHEQSENEGSDGHSGSMLEKGAPRP